MGVVTEGRTPGHRIVSARPCTAHTCQLSGIVLAFWRRPIIAAALAAASSRALHTHAYIRSRERFPAPRVEKSQEREYNVITLLAASAVQCSPVQFGFASRCVVLCYVVSIVEININVLHTPLRIE